ncbi:hypothetical protein G6F23_002077 [Rhizopus arrhizus]|nr:hypothetical protein G6F23_002077 [Rhizopus arrhizus]
MKLFFATATHHWDPTQSIKRFNLPNGEAISCVLWDNLFFISGTDIIRSLTFRFYAFGRPVSNSKKFEEGVFSDLRNLKPSHDARLEDPKSDLLDMLYKNNCIRTQKKQKVFFWFSVPHDRLFLDALERDLKREKMGLEPTTCAVAKPATSLTLDSTPELFEELKKTISFVKDPLPTSTLSLTQVTPKDDPWSPSLTIKRSRVNSVPASVGQQQKVHWMAHRHHHLSHNAQLVRSHQTGQCTTPADTHKEASCAVNRMPSEVLSSTSLDLKKQKALFGTFSLRDGSSKQRRRRTISSTQSSPAGVPDRVRHHEKCHHPAPKSTNFSRVPSFGPPPSVNNHSSRLARAAHKAGLVQPTAQPVSAGWTENQMSSALYFCPTLSDQQQDLFDTRLKIFTCHLCSKEFSRSEHLEEHTSIEHFTSLPEKEDGGHVVDPFNDDHQHYMNPLIDQQGYTGNTTLFQTIDNQQPWAFIDFEMQEANMVNDDLFSANDQQHVYDSVMSSTSSSTNSLKQYYEDDFSSSTISSPPDLFHSSSMTLFSSFKPVFLDQEEKTISFDDIDQYNSFYAPYIDPYNCPFSTDMNFTFGP